MSLGIPSDKPLCRVVIATIAFVLCYAEVLRDLVKHWATNPVYSFGFAVPLIAGYVVWSRWRQIRSAYGRPDYVWGAVCVLVGSFMLAIGRAGALMSFEGISMIPTLAGLVLLVAGPGVLRVVRFPLTYLLLMLPVWGRLFTLFQPASQQLSATVATWMLHAVGVPALQQQTTIVLSSVSMDVLPECSGINQLIALTIMALPAAILWLETRPARIALVGVGIVVGFLSNGARIAVLGWLTSKGLNVNDPHSAIHLVPGFLTALTAYLIVGGCVSLLSRFKLEHPISPSPLAPAQGSHAPQSRKWIEAVIALVLIGQGATMLLAGPSEVSPITDFQGLPSQIADWTLESNGKPESDRFVGFDVDVIGAYPSPSGQQRFTGLDSQILRTYRRDTGDRVQLYVGYYRRQKSGKELTGDVSWGLDRVSSIVSVQLESMVVRLGEVEQRKDDTRRGLVYWYDVNGRVVPQVYMAKGLTLWDTLTRGRSNGAVVMIGWSTTKADDSARERAIEFARSLLPVLRGFFPS